MTAGIDRHLDLSGILENPPLREFLEETARFYASRVTVFDANAQIASGR